MLVLGIIAVVSLGGAAATAAVAGLPLDLTLVAMIVAGAALVLNSTSLSGRIIGTFVR